MTAAEEEEVVVYSAFRGAGQGPFSGPNIFRCAEPVGIQQHYLYDLEYQEEIALSKNYFRP